MVSLCPTFRDKPRTEHNVEKSGFSITKKILSEITVSNGIFHDGCAGGFDSDSPVETVGMWLLGGTNCRYAESVYLY